ncbi:PaaX family transcriptional regulator C-terminal domain-containing protein [Nocardioides sp. QY071]|uniref:PaaX family transcriptional regulator n=1 Tax=Nocardioides sp. QY071 TaxID=3044187 RepID=UPI00249C31FC|nr:PaaX family transcriptional regulator C-terminal domain-containing protein [Nocardioides sp. QY071]WGY00390.1 PaaX family transcriptional regulator C-terminal domain-containing protein [Nocardioides sp. QY071]
MSRSSTPDDESTIGAAVAEASATSGTAADIGAEVPPQQLIFSVFGLFSARHRDTWLSSAAIVRLATALGIQEPLTRSAISRMKRRGYLTSRKVEGQAGYELSASSVRILADGDNHVYGRPRARAEDSWIVVGFSVPESRRERRHQIRTALIRLGFGTVSPGMWIAPGHVDAEVRGTLRRLGVTEFVDVFRADYLAFGDPRDKVASWWDLDALTGMYDVFVERFGTLAEHLGDLTAEQAFAAYVPMLTTWRRLPYLDPGLPLALLPDPWAGSVAEELFRRLDRHLRADAEEFAFGHL